MSGSLSGSESPAAPPGGQEPAWRLFARGFAATAALLGLAAIGFVAALDPYGLRAAPGRAPGPIMDSNQRFMYPQIARSGAYDAAVIGTSTARLIDPRQLDRAFGARFANLAINAATPYEQTQLARLFLHGAQPRAVLFALDATWCDPDADRRLTFRPFPPWLYAQHAPFAFLQQVNWRSLGIAGAVALHRLGLARARIRGDGFAVFTPPEASYDARRAAAHIRSGVTALDDPDAAREAEPRATRSDGAMPALAWLDALLAATPAGTLKLVAFMPVNVAAQPRPGTDRAGREAACKRRVAEIGRERGASVVDFRIPSTVTSDDTNYWDALHYRLPIAARIVAGLKAAASGGRDDPDGFYRVLAHP